jgi:hypothetical protein
MTSPLIYIVRADMPDDFLDEHHEWYARKHAPDVVGAGFTSARGYDAPEKPRMWNIYEVPSVAVFSSDTYNNSHKNDPFVAVAVTKLVGRTVSVYTQLACLGADRKSILPVPTLYGPGLSLMRFDTEADAGKVGNWFNDAIVAKLPAASRPRTVRLWEQREQHPKWASTEPRWGVAAEWASDREAEASGIRDILKAGAGDATVKATNVLVNVVQKRFGLVREDLFVSQAPTVAY